MTNQNNSTEEKKSFLGKIIGKLVKWTIILVLGFIVLVFALRYFDKRQEEFINESINLAVINCNNEQACLQNVKAHGRECVKGNYHQEKVSKRVKKSVLDEEGFFSCLSSFK